MIALHFWSEITFWLIGIHWGYRYAALGERPWDNTYFSKTIVVNEKEKEWDE